MIIVALAVCFVGIGFIIGFLYQRWSHAVPILMYHRIADIPGDRLAVSPAEFQRQLAFLYQHHYQTIRLDDLVAHLYDGVPLPAKPVLLTFDDGYADNAEYALPLLQQYGMTAIVFVISQWVGMPNDWEAYPGKPRCTTMNWEQLFTWCTAGMDVGSHTVTHPNLDEISDNQLVYELRQSKATLEAQLGRAIRFIAYPRGIINERIKQAAQETGYAGGVAVFDGTSPFRNDRYALRRIIISSTNSLRSFAMKVSPWHVALIELRRLERKATRRRQRSIGV